MADLVDRIYLEILIVRCQIGNPSGFEELIAICQPRLRRFLGKLVSDWHQAEDLTQDVWIVVFKSIRKLQDPGAFWPWLYRIARNRAFQLLRRRGAIFEHDSRVDLVADMSDSDDFVAEDAQTVHAALDHLVPEHREVLLLRFMEEMSYEEIASVVGCQLGTVKSRIHNAKCELRKTLESQARHGLG